MIQRRALRLKQRRPRVVTRGLFIHGEGGSNHRPPACEVTQVRISYDAFRRGIGWLGKTQLFEVVWWFLKSIRIPRLLLARPFEAFPDFGYEPGRTSVYEVTNLGQRVLTDFDCWQIGAFWAPDSALELLNYR